MLDECKGDRLEEVLSVFSTAVLKRLVQDDGGHQAIAQQLALEKFHYTSVPTEDLSVLLLAHQVSLRRILERRLEAGKFYNAFAKVLREKDEQLVMRKEELEKAIEEDESTEFVSRAETQVLQDRVRKNWYGSNEWLESVIHGDGPTEDGGLLSQPFDKVWKDVEAGDLEEVEGRRRKGLLEQLDARVQEQNSRLEKWMSFGEQISARRKGEKKEEKKEVKVSANLDLGLGAHETLQLKSMGKDEKKTWSPNRDNARLLDRLQRDLANVGKSKRVVSPAKRRVPVYEEIISRSPSPEPIARSNNTPRKRDWANSAQDNTPRAQDWEPQDRDGRESVDLDGSHSPNPSLQQQQVQNEDVEMDMGEPEPQHQEEDEDSYEEINHSDAMDIDEPEPTPPTAPQPKTKQPEERVYPEQFMAPPAGSPLLRDSPAIPRVRDQTEFSSMPPIRGPSLLRTATSNSSHAAKSHDMDDLADMTPPPAHSKLRASPSPYAAQNMDMGSMPPPSVPQTLRRSTVSKTDLQARLRSSAKKSTGKKSSPAPPAPAKEEVPESPDLATKILNSMDAASPSPVKQRQQPLSLAERAHQSMAASSAMKPRDPTPQIDSDDDSLEQFTPRPTLSRGNSNVVSSGPSTITRSMTLADRTRQTMSSLRNSMAQISAQPEPDPAELLDLTPRRSEALVPTPSAAPMTLRERTMMSMSSMKPKSTIKKSRQSIANLEEYDELQLVPSPQPLRNPKIRLSSVPYMSGMAEDETPSVDDFGMAEEAAKKTEAGERSDDLVERTRQSMRDLDLAAVASKAQLERKKSVRAAARKKRESFLPQRNSVYEDEDTMQLIEHADEVDYEDAFRSRPKIAMSPNISPMKGGWREGSVSPFPG